MKLTKEQQLKTVFKIIIKSYINIDQTHIITPMTNDLLREVKLRTNLTLSNEEKSRIKILTDGLLKV